jgi:hypothetical protein
MVTDMRKEVFQEELVKIEKEVEGSHSYPWNLIEAKRYFKEELRIIELTKQKDNN